MKATQRVLLKVPFGYGQLPILMEGKKRLEVTESAWVAYRGKGRAMRVKGVRWSQG